MEGWMEESQSRVKDCLHQSKIKKSGKSVGGWMGGWVGGWKDGSVGCLKAALRIAYSSNKKGITNMYCYDKGFALSNMMART